MKILVIEDDNNKFSKIFNTLNGILNECEIIRTKSRNSGLFKIFESIKTNERFDLIICDNYLPLLDDEIEKNVSCSYEYDTINKLNTF